MRKNQANTWIDRSIFNMVKELVKELHFKFMGSKSRKELIFSVLSQYLNEEVTLKDMANERGITHERIRQIKEQGLRLIGAYIKRAAAIEKGDISVDGSRVKELEAKVKMLKELIEKDHPNLQGQVQHIEVLNPILFKKIADINFSVRILNCMKAAEKETILDLVRMDKKTLTKFRNLGASSIREIEDFLSEHGLRLGMKI